MAHKKGQGSVRNGRDSNAQRRGIKKYAGETVVVGSILARQCGTKWHPGRNVKRASDDTLFALAAGTVYFDAQGRRMNVKPFDAAPASGGQQLCRLNSTRLSRPFARSPVVRV